MEAYVVTVCLEGRCEGNLLEERENIHWWIEKNGLRAVK